MYLRGRRAQHLCPPQSGATISCDHSHHTNATQRWTLMPYALILSCVHPAAIVRCAWACLVILFPILPTSAAAARSLEHSPGSATSIGSPAGWYALRRSAQRRGDKMNFSQGKNSSANKQRRLLGELHSHAQASGSCFANRCGSDMAQTSHCAASSLSHSL